MEEIFFDFDLSDPKQRKLYNKYKLEYLKAKKEQRKKSNKIYLKGQRGVRKYYDYSKTDYDEDSDEIERPVKCIFKKDLRREKLFAYLKYLNGKRILVRDLAWHFAVTERTIQMDLRWLEDNNFITTKMNKTYNGKQTKNSYIVNKSKEKDLPCSDRHLEIVFLKKLGNGYFVLTKCDTPKSKLNRVPKPLLFYFLPTMKIKNINNIDKYSLKIANRIFMQDMSKHYKGKVFDDLYDVYFNTKDKTNKGERIREKYYFSLFVFDEDISANNRYTWLKLSSAPRIIRNRIVHKCFKYIKEYILG